MAETWQGEARRNDAPAARAGDGAPAANGADRAIAPADLLRFFYPVHYQIAGAIEDVLSGGVLSRKQVVILQVIRSEGEDGRRIRRKTVEQALHAWFEITSSAISKALRAMARPPLGLIAISEDPSSGRERVVTLTERGLRFLADTDARAEAYFAALLRDVPPELLAPAADYFRHLTLAHSRVPAPRLHVVADLTEDAGGAGGEPNKATRRSGRKRAEKP
jgi:DNA-binding MarR family transcriptional regulator